MLQIDKNIETFKEEAYELLTELETSVLELEDAPEDTELIDRVFRAIHTIKGSGAMFGFDDIANFAHELEAVFELVRKKEIVATKELIRLILSARDYILTMFKASEGGEVADEEKAREIIVLLSKFIPNNVRKNEENECHKTVPSKDNTLSSKKEGSDVTYRIRFRPPQNIFMNGTDPVCLLNELRELGKCETVAQIDTIPKLDEINPELCYTYWDVVLTTNQGINAIKDVFVFIEDDSELNITVVDDNNNLNNEGNCKKLGEILVERGDVMKEDLHEKLKEQKSIGEMLVDAGLATSDKVQSALVEQQHIRDVSAKKQETVLSVRVPSGKLDNFVDLIGELVIAQARLSQVAVRSGNPELLSVSEDVGRLTEGLRESAMDIRMLPIGTTFNKFKRLVHDLSSELGREIELTTSGGETELDKTVMERLNEPLVHIIRNSIDHGIEPPDEREAIGKPRRGMIHFSAIHSGYNILIKIMDDGKGLDSDAIRAKAIENGLITENTKLNERELFALIFNPGFSTAEKVTNISGRGVGMDVVKCTLEALRGSVDVDSILGVGTTITIKLPLTLAIIEGLQVEVDDECFVLPLSVVEECVEMTHKEVVSSNGNRLINVRGEIIPYIHLRSRFMIDGGPPSTEQVVIVKADGGRVGFVVDHVIGEHQTVIKTMGIVYRNVKGVSGATILGDGRVALILDIPKLIEGVELQQSGNERRQT